MPAQRSAAAQDWYIFFCYMTLFVITLENAVVYQIWTDDEEGAVVFDQWSSPAPPHPIVNTVPDVRPEKSWVSQ